MSESAKSAWPTELIVSQQGRVLTLRLENGETLVLTAELLRVESPSAEVKGHGPGEETLQSGKKDVAISRVEAVGNYAVRLHFTDGHNSGIYTWNYLTVLGRETEARLAAHLAKLKKAGLPR